MWTQKAKTMYTNTAQIQNNPLPGQYSAGMQCVYNVKKATPMRKKAPSTNKEWKIVFTCNKRHVLGKYMRIFIGAGQIAKYVGPENAITALIGAAAAKGDKYTKKFRTHGRLEFYRN